MRKKLLGFIFPKVHRAECKDCEMFCDKRKRALLFPNNVLHVLQKLCSVGGILGEKLLCYMGGGSNKCKSSKVWSA